MIELLIIAGLCALCDMLRGGLFSRHIKHYIFISAKIPAMVMVASLYSVVIGATPWSLIFIAWLPIVSKICGTGNPIGKLVLGHSAHAAFLAAKGIDPDEDWEKYQFTNNGWITSATLGLLWSAGAIPVAFLTGNYDWFLVVIAYGISFPLAGIITRKYFDKDDRWLSIEGLRSGLAMTGVGLCLM